jgi:hypothetical protein
VSETRTRGDAPTRDLYQLLGVPRAATQADIRWAYERTMAEARRVGSIRHATEISQAFDILSDPRRRATYDRLGAAPRERVPATARASVPWRASRPSHGQHARNVRPQSSKRGRWRTPIYVVFGLGIVLGALIVYTVTHRHSDQGAPTVANPAREVVCTATPSGAGYTYFTTAVAPFCRNGALPRIVRP